MVKKTSERLEQMKYSFFYVECTITCKIQDREIRPYRVNTVGKHTPSSLEKENISTLVD